MSDPHQPEDWASLGTLWRSAPRNDGTFHTVDVDAARVRAATFARKIRRRNLTEILAGLLVVAAGLRIAWTGPRPLVIAGGVAMALGALLTTASLLLRAGNARPPALDAPTREVLAHEQRELERQARLLERVWLWYLAPLLPGVALIDADALLLAIESADQRGIAVNVAVLVAMLLCFLFVGHLNARAARRLRARARAIVSEEDDGGVL